MTVVWRKMCECLRWSNRRKHKPFTKTMVHEDVLILQSLDFGSVIRKAVPAGAVAVVGAAVLFVEVVNTVCDGFSGVSAMRTVSYADVASRVIEEELTPDLLFRSIRRIPPRGCFVAMGFLEDPPVRKLV